MRLKREIAFLAVSLLIFINIFDIIIIEIKRKENFLMTLKALAVILEFCMNQELSNGPVLLEDAM